MAITTLAQLNAAKRELITFQYTTSTAVSSNIFYSMITTASNNTTGVLAGTSTTTGVVPTDATAGFPRIESFNGNPGYLVQLDFSNAQLCRMRLYDLLWKAGAYTFNANTTGQTPTSYASRVPGGTDFVGTQIWLEQVTQATGVQNVNVTYINEAGTAGRSTGTVASSASSIGQMIRLPLQSGDQGVQGVTGVVGSVASAGTFNILVIRPLWTGRVELAASSTGHGLDRLMMPQVFDNSALALMISADGSATSVPCVELVICNG